MEKAQLTEQFFVKARKLVNRYPHLHFGDHSYWRIALDNTLKGKWDEIIDRPAYENLTLELMEIVVSWLDAYWDDEQLLLLHNEKSKAYRKLSEIQ